jgi:hypothetical protein
MLARHLLLVKVVYEECEPPSHQSWIHKVVAYAVTAFCLFIQESLGRVDLLQSRHKLTGMPYADPIVQSRASDQHRRVDYPRFDVVERGIR